MGQNLKERLSRDILEYRAAAEKFKNGELAPADYKGISGGFGTYPQKGNETHMLRLRMTGGRLPLERLRFLVDSCEKYKVGAVKLTTCQSIQYHDVAVDDLYPLMSEAWEAGFITRGGGGNHPRNVMASPLSGVQKGENFDVLPYAEAAADYLLQIAGVLKFPRKLKVAFSNSIENVTHATFRDLGFVSTPDGKFDVWAAGGLGNKPMLGVCMDRGIDPADVLYYVGAMVATFREHGNYENRNKARTRFMQETLGVDGLIREFHKHLDALKASESLKLTVCPTETEKKPDGTMAEGGRILAQKQTDLYAVSYHPFGGYLPVAMLGKLYGAMQTMQGTEIRVTPDGGLYVIHCTAKEAKTILALTEGGAETAFERSVACVGGTRCSTGTIDSQGLLTACLAAVKKENFADGVLPTVRISGCPSSCAAHQTAALGFRGGTKRGKNGVKPAFAVFVGGSELQGKEALAPTGHMIFADLIPTFLVTLGKAIRLENTTFDRWIKEHEEDLADMIGEFANME